MLELVCTVGTLKLCSVFSVSVPMCGNYMSISFGLTTGHNLKSMCFGLQSVDVLVT